MLHRAALPLLILTLAAGCGVQAGDDGGGADCREVKRFTPIKADLDALDREIRDLRPTVVNPKSLKALAPKYRDASKLYGLFLKRARVELATSRTAGLDFTAVLEVLTESLSIRRDGMAFIADAVANPVNLQNASVQAEIDELSRKMNDVNARLEEASTRFFQDQGFEQRADGPFVIEC